MSALLAPWGREQEPGRGVHPSTALCWAQNDPRAWTAAPSIPRGGSAFARQLLDRGWP